MVRHFKLTVALKKVLESKHTGFLFYFTLPIDRDAYALQSLGRFSRITQKKKIFLDHSDQTDRTILTDLQWQLVLGQCPSSASCTEYDRSARMQDAGLHRLPF